MDYERQERDLARQAKAERIQEKRREAIRIGAFVQKGLALEAPLDIALTYRHDCARCDSAIAEFEQPVRRDSLRSKLCDSCLDFKVRQIGYQKLLIKHPQWRDL